MNAFAFGAKAVLFLGPPEGSTPDIQAYHHANTPANLPRFYVPHELAVKLDLTNPHRPGKVTIRAACQWKELRGRNVIAVLRGTNPVFEKGGLRQIVLLAAPLDSYSEVPELSPGARDAGNCAALLQIAEYLRTHRPRRDVVLCFFDGQTLNHAGARAFYGALYRRIKNTKLADATLDDRLKEQDQETTYFQQILDVLNQRDLMGSAARQMKYFDDALRLLRDEARNTGDGIEEVLSPKRVAFEEIQKDLARLRKASQAAATAEQKAPLDAEIQARQGTADALDAEIKVLAEQSLQWNSVQRMLRYKTPDPQNQETFDRLLEIFRSKYRRRLEEIAQASQETRLGKRLYQAIGPQSSTIVLHVSIDLGDARRRWTFIHGDDSAPVDNDRTGMYTYHFKTLNAVAQALGDRVKGFDDRAVSQLYDNRLFAPGRFADSGPIARLFSVWNLSVMTVMDRRPRQGLPTDTLAALDSKTLYDQAGEVAVFLKHLADDEGINLLPKTRAEVRFGEASWTGIKSVGPRVNLSGIGGALRTRSIGDAFVAIFPNNGWGEMPMEKAVPGFVDWFLCKTNVHGIFETGPYSTNYYKKPYFVAVMFDRGTGDEEDLATGRGLIEAITNTSRIGGSTGSAADFTKASPVIFKTHYKTLVNYGADRGAVTSTAMRAMSTAAFPKDRSLLCEWGNISSVFAPADAKGIKLFNKMTLVVLNNAKSKDRYQGQGLSLDDPFDHPASPPMTAHDLRTLNEYRLQLLREVRIHQESLETLTGRAKDLETDAQAGRGKAPAGWYFGTLETSAAFSRLVYIPLIDVMNDLVTAVVLLLLLAMPFAYALERLVIGSPHIYRQIGWFALFFLATFALLFSVNPAFKIASTPIIIFLAFAIILLSSLVIFIMVRKLQTEVRKMQGLSATVHSADVSRLSTMMAAVNMGISTMRRRPLRTLLTAITVVLLTFTILTFASFGSSWGIWPSYQGAMTSLRPHIVVRHPLWSPITHGVFETLGGYLGKDAEIVPRIWVSGTAQQTKDAYTAGASLEKMLSDEGARRIVPMAAAIGLDPADLADAQGRPRQEELAELFAPSDRVDLLAADGIFLTEAIANELKLTPADIGQAKLLLAGMTFTYAGTVSDRLATATMLDGSSVLPVDYEASAGESEENINEQATTTLSLVEMPDVQSAQFVTFNVDKVVIIPAAKARRLDGTIRSVSIYPADDKVATIRDMADTITRIAQVPTHVGDQGGVHRLVFTSLVRASGWRDLLVPVVLGGLIIFATMLGSVSDREREIYTFSSLGLAPPHVASLFFAEASMYAVLGGMGGYLLGQVVARLLAWVSGTFGWSVPTMNYSSTNALVTIVIVMGTVLVSTIYPAIKASRSANPGIQRTWQIPKPKGNLYDLIFPFTVSTYDITGVVSFLKEHFENYTDTSLGVFATTSCSIFRQKGNDMLGFQATVALAPFDLGVNQRFALLSQPSDIEGIDEVRILIYRLSGAPGDWQRGNRVFIHDLRKQLLIWRSLPAEVMDKYRAKTLGGWDQLPVEQVDGESIGGTA
ncbi:MAG: M28 family peptidase [Phycisphaerae bacterium]|nr:M28 family peptidase [Phycisphaerae bacterium]